MNTIRHANAEHELSLTRQEKIGVWVTDHANTMTCVYIFFGIGMGSLIGIATNNLVLSATFGAISSYVIQLVFLPLLGVSSKVQAKHDAIRADIQYEMETRLEVQITQILAALEMLNRK